MGRQLGELLYGNDMRERYGGSPQDYMVGWNKDKVGVVVSDSLLL